MGAHFLQIVAGAEPPARAGQDDDTNRFVAGSRVELSLKRGDHVRGQRIEAVAAVERERQHAVVRRSHDQRIGGGGFGRRCQRIVLIRVRERRWRIACRKTVGECLIQRRFANALFFAMRVVMIGSRIHHQSVARREPTLGSRLQAPGFGPPNRGVRS